MGTIRRVKLSDPDSILRVIRDYTAHHAPKGDPTCYLSDVRTDFDYGGALVADMRILGLADTDTSTWEHDPSPLATVRALALGDGRTELTITACDDLAAWAQNIAAHIDGLFREVPTPEAAPAKRAAPGKRSDSRTALTPEGQKALVRKYWEARRSGLVWNPDDCVFDEDKTRITQEEWAKERNVSGRTLRRYIAEYPELRDMS